MKNIIRYEIHYGGSLRSGMLNIAKASMIRNKPCIENELITNEQSIVLSLSRLLDVINMTNDALEKPQNAYLKKDYFENMKKKEFDKNHFDNLDELIKGKGKKFDLIKNTLIDPQSQDIENINRCFKDERNDRKVFFLKEKNCVGLKFIDVISNSYGKIYKIPVFMQDDKLKKDNKFTYIDEHVLDKIYKLCVSFKDELLLFENYNSFNPIKEKFDIVKSFFASKIKRDSVKTKLNEDDFNLL